MSFFSPFERMVAFRYLRARRQEGFISVVSWFSLLGIGLGVATLIIVMAVMNGFRVDMLSRLLGMNGHLNVYTATGAMMVDYTPLAEKLSKVPGVIAVSPVIEGQALITANNSASGAMIRGVEPAQFKARPIVYQHIVQGSLDSFEGDGVAIGWRMAQRLGLHVGDQLTLISPSSKATVFGSAPRMKAYVIAAIFNVDMYEYDNGFVFMPLEAAKTFFHTFGGITGLELYVDNPYDLAAVKTRVSDALGPTDTRLVDWQQNNSFFTALQVERNVMFLILTLIIVVAAFNIISGLYMLVKDKGRDIAILRTMGASRGAVMRIFFMAGASIGVLGTGFGLALGIAFAKNIELIREGLQKLTGTNLFSAEIYFLSHLPAILDWHEVLQVVVMSLTVSFLATLYPAWRAAKLDPVEALRYE